MSQPETKLPKHVHLLRDRHEWPVPFTSVKHVGGHAWSHNPTIGTLFPVDGKRIEVVVTEVHHREKRIHHTRTKPLLGVLAYRRAGIPSARRIATQVLGLANGRTTHHYPWLQTLHSLADGCCYGRNVSAPLLPGNLQLPRFRVADIVQMDSIHIVATDDFLADISQIGSCLYALRIHIAVRSYLLDQLRIALAQCHAASRRPFAHGNRHHPRMKLHASLMALVDGKLKGIVAWTLAGIAAQTAIPRLHARRIDGCTAHTCLQKHHICSGSLQLVEYSREFLLLLLYAGSRTVGIGVWPVYASDRGKPHSTHLIFG